MEPSLALDDYFGHVAELFAGLGAVRLAEAHAVAFEGATYGVLRLGIEYTGPRFSIVLPASVALGYPQWIDDSFQLRRDDDAPIFRYDNAPHHREVSTFPHHKHVGEGEHVIAAEQPSIARIVAEVTQYLGA